MNIYELFLEINVINKIYREKNFVSFVLTTEWLENIEIIFLHKFPLKFFSNFL